MLNNRKGLLILLVFLILLGALTGCSVKNEGGKDVPLRTIEEGIKQKVTLDHMKKKDKEKLVKLYHIDHDEVQDFVLYMPESNVEANELAVIKVKQAEQAENIKEKIVKRVEAQEIKFKDYRPKEYNLVEKHVLKIKDLYILFAVSKDAEQIENAFDAALK